MEISFVWEFNMLIANSMFLRQPWKCDMIFLVNVNLFTVGKLPKFQAHFERETRWTCERFFLRYWQWLQLKIGIKATSITVINFLKFSIFCIQKSINSYHLMLNILSAFPCNFFNLYLKNCFQSDFNVYK